MSIFRSPRDFIARVKEKALGEDVLRSITPGQQIVKIFHDELTALLGGDAAPLNLENRRRILIVGLNGSRENNFLCQAGASSEKAGSRASFDCLRFATTGGDRTTGNAGKTNRVRYTLLIRRREECAARRC